MVPAACSLSDVEYGTRCVFYCSDGYELSGPRYTTCEDNATWDQLATLSCVKGRSALVKLDLYYSYSHRSPDTSMSWYFLRGIQSVSEIKDSPAY